MHSRCDLACNHCYIYRGADQSWRRRPRRMPLATLEQVAGRIGEHVATHRLRSIELILHGGEPLLAGREFVAQAVTAVRAAVGGAAKVAVSVQTNGLRLDGPTLDDFDRLGIRVGVSLDGDADAHDLHRRHADGRGSHAAVAAALDLLRSPAYAHLYSGLLTTVDLRNDPVRTYESLLAHAPPAIDLLLPHGTWSAPPPGRGVGTVAAHYADWLLAVFDRWYGAGRPETEIRLFQEIIHLLLGGASATEAVGLSPLGVVVVETDGSIEQSDILKIVAVGAPETGLHVAHHSFDDALRLPAFAARQIGVSALCAQCRSCPVHRVCGGGLYPHRHRADGSGFANPSVYCPDLFTLVNGVRERISAGLAALR